MPRDSQGLYTLPAGYNPVSPGTLIEAAWANTTMNDLAQAMTDSLPRSGSAPMTGPLTLAVAPPVSPRHAASKSYVDNFVAYSTGMPVGALMAFAAGSVPGGFVLCNGQAVSRTTYAALFALVGTSFGAGDGSTTFNVPNLINQFIRGRDPVTRAVGSVQTDTFKSHLHPVSDPTHNHTLTDPTHTHSQIAHSHIATQPAHSHSYVTPNAAGTGLNAGSGNVQASNNTGTAQPTITVDSAQPPIGSSSTGQTLAAALTGLSVGAAGDTETRPQNIAFDIYVKALQDSGGPVAVLSIDTSDANMIAIDNTTPTAPILDIKANVAFGTVKLDGAAKIPSFLLPAGNQNLLGLFNASTGNNPSQEYPTTTFLNGDTFIVGVAGTIDVFDPATGLSSPTVVDVGNELLYINGSTINPDGWYYIIATVTVVVASDVAFAPSGGIQATNVQAALEELDTEKLAVIASSVDGYIPQWDGATGKLLKAGMPIQTTPFDGTPAAVLTVGAFGLGAMGAVYVADLNVLERSGFYSYSGSTLNAPPMGGFGTVLMHGLDGSGNDCAQIATQITGGLVGTAIRTQLNGTWSDWKTILNVADYGLGATNIPFISGLDATNVPSGFYQFNAGTGTPPAGQGGAGCVQVISFGSNIATQLWVTYGQNNVFTRTCSAPNVWTPWEEVAHTGSNVASATTATTLTGNTTAAIQTAALGGGTANASTVLKGDRTFGTVPSLGVGQTWQNFTGSRVIGTLYTNSTSMPIMVSVWATIATQFQYLNCFVAGVEVARSAQAAVATFAVGIQIVVPPGATYQVNSSSGATSNVGWNELRA